MLRLFLDAHLSGRNIGRPLRAQGHDVRAVAEERVLDGLGDEPLLALASDDRRILVTANVKDFLPILGRWAEARRAHTGCILIPSTFRQEQFGAIVASIEVLLDRTPDQKLWRDRVAWVTRAGR